MLAKKPPQYREPGTRTNLKADKPRGGVLR
jgi:hypothetical protein